MPMKEPEERAPWKRLGEELLSAHHRCGAAIVGVTLAAGTGERDVAYICPTCDGIGPVAQAALAGEHL